MDMKTSNLNNSLDLVPGVILKQVCVSKIFTTEEFPSYYVPREFFLSQVSDKVVIVIC